MKKKLTFKKELLRRMYLDEQLSLGQIAKKFRISRWKVRNLSSKFNIPIRKKSEGFSLRTAKRFKHPLSSFLKEIIFGGLLGDFHLSKPGENAKSSRITFECKHRIFVKFLKGLFEKDGIRTTKIYENKRFTQRKYLSYTIATHRYLEFFSLRKIFYPKNKKIVPLDIKLTSRVCKFWYLGDGTLIFDKRCKNSKGRITLSTHGFPRKSVRLLRDKLKFLDIEARHSKENALCLNVDATVKFLNHIGPYPSTIKNVYGYKFQKNS